MIDFAALIGLPLDPWQRWLAIHLGELRPDGRPRFRRALVIVARQNGKTRLALVWLLYWLFVVRAPQVLGMSTDRGYAKADWQEVCELVTTTAIFAPELGRRPIRPQMGEEQLLTRWGCSYRFAANNRRAGRSLTVWFLLVDELREHANYDAWTAATNATNAVAGAQILAISNQGDLTSVVMNDLRADALAYLATGRGADDLGLFEWSVPEGSSPTDPVALGYANPFLDRRMHRSALLGAAETAVRTGGEALARFKTEVMCEAVDALDAAIDPAAWAAAGTDSPIDLAEHRDRVCLCLDLAFDGTHATVVAAALVPDEQGRELVHVEVVAAWEGPACSAQLRDQLPDLAKRIRPARIGWFPKGPAAAVAAKVRTPKGQRRTWAPRRTEVAELVGETSAVCMGLAEVVGAGELRQPRDELLTEQVRRSRKLASGDAGTWVFTRKESGPIDATYALAGAVHLARSLPPPKGPLKVG